MEEVNEVPVVAYRKSTPNYNKLRRAKFSKEQIQEKIMELDQQLDLLIDENSKFIYCGKSRRRRILVDKDTEPFSFQFMSSGLYIDVYARIKDPLKYRHYSLRSVGRYILNLTDPNLKADHINHNQLDNRSCNLRPCTHSENMRNRMSYSTTARYKGLNPGKSGYRMQVQTHGVRRSWPLSNDAQEELLARIYDCIALKYFGEFANTNFDKNNYSQTVIDGVNEFMDEYLKVTYRKKKTA